MTFTKIVPPFTARQTCWSAWYIMQRENHCSWHCREPGLRRSLSLCIYRKVAMKKSTLLTCLLLGVAIQTSNQAESKSSGDRANRQTFPSRLYSPFYFGGQPFSPFSQYYKTSSGLEGKKKSVINMKYIVLIKLI